LRAEPILGHRAPQIRRWVPCAPAHREAGLYRGWAMTSVHLQTLLAQRGISEPARQHVAHLGSPQLPAQTPTQARAIEAGRRNPPCVPAEPEHQERTTYDRRSLPLRERELSFSLPACPTTRPQPGPSRQVLLVLLLEGMDGTALRSLRLVAPRYCSDRKVKRLTVCTVLRWWQERPNEKPRWSFEGHACQADRCAIGSADCS